MVAENKKSKRLNKLCPVKVFHDISTRLDTIPALDRQTDRQTDGRTEMP